MKKQLQKTFENPGSEYRGAPFWAWNGKLEPEELRRQIRLMHRMGLGGFFMHSRVGLDTAYLSEEWFECVNACIDEAEKLDMQAWLYDEDRWPSGAAGGKVTCNPKYRARYIAMDHLKSAKELEWSGKTVAAFKARVKEDTASDIRRIKRGSTPRLGKGETILVFRVQVAQPSSWYNGYTYLDTMSREAVREFIKQTHEVYLKNCGEHFGKRVPGIFTDEPNCPGGMPWTGRFAETFRKRYGYDLLDHLPELVFKVDGREVYKARRDYHDCMTFLFVDAFARQIGAWCEKHNLEHTGHVLMEETLQSQSRVVGSCMRFYEYMQAPGMDLLTEHSREINTAKQVSSVANQFGRKWRLTETYGCTGWDFSFEGHKALGDWQAAMGINVRCQHLAWYTMLGSAKRDYPAGIFYQSPWWEDYPMVEDYFARINAVMTQGKEVRRILVIHPIESMWSVMARGQSQDRDQIDVLNRMYLQVKESLLMANLDFDYGDEDIMARHGKVIRRNGSGMLRVAQAEYSTIVVPPLLTMRKSTLRLLKAFRKAGGAIVFAGKPSPRVDVEETDAVVEFAETCARAPAVGPKLTEAVAKTGRVISICDGDGREIPSTLYLCREDANASYLFVVNTGHTAAFLMSGKPDPLVRDRKQAWSDVRIRGFAECGGQPIELDPASGEIRGTDSRRGRNDWEIKTSLPRLGSRLFLIPKKKSRALKPREKLKTVTERKLQRKQWKVSLSESNVLVLDRPRYRIDGGSWRGPSDIIQVDHAVRDDMGVARRGGRMVQPWAQKHPKKLRGRDIELDYQFTAASRPSGDLWLAMERPETFKVTVNGLELDRDTDNGWWCDRSLKKLRIDPVDIVPGKNRIRVTGRYDEQHSGLEIMYLLGNFGVTVRGTDLCIGSSVETLKTGNWVKQGLPFFAGSVSYLTSVTAEGSKKERVFVCVPEYRGTAVRVLVDGKSAGVIAWEPNEIEVTDLLNPDGSEIAIQVIGHRRNSHGPLHMKKKWPRWTGPGEFEQVETEEYNLVPCGLMSDPRLEIRR